MHYALKHFESELYNSFVQKATILHIALKCKENNIVRVADLQYLLVFKRIATNLF